tara:strand:+ start:5399 stop:6340 length:942 start_codon:yes stop_codon:yes gene_type:complete
MDLYTELKNKNNKALSKTITLAESTLEKDQLYIQKLLSKFTENHNTIRIGVTGIPGVGKSSFIEKFGQTFLNQGKSVAVLAIDPSSEKTSGSILGDKSRMEKLSLEENAFIRPSSNNGTLGGVSNKTRDCILLCEAAGYDVIIIETVGVGQSETTVSKLVDIMLLLTITGAGDQLQAIKRGIIELAHLIIITKDDGDNKIKAKQTLIEFKNILSINPPVDEIWLPKVVKCSSIKNIGINQINTIVNQFENKAREIDSFVNKRREQKIYWIKKVLKDELGNRKYLMLKKSKELNKIIKNIISGKNDLYNVIKEN